MPESTKAGSLGNYLRGSINPGTAGLALAGYVTLDKHTPFSEPPLPVWNHRTGSRGSHLLFQLNPVFACPAQMLVIPGTSQHRHWTGNGAGPFGHGQQLASEPGLCCSVHDPTSWEHLAFTRYFTALKEEGAWMLG